MGRAEVTYSAHAVHSDEHVAKTKVAVRKVELVEVRYPRGYIEKMARRLFERTAARAAQRRAHVDSPQVRGEGLENHVEVVLSMPAFHEIIKHLDDVLVRESA